MTKSKALSNVTMAPTKAVPDEAPAAPQWVGQPLEKLTVYDIQPAAYFSRQWLKQFLKDHDMEALILTVKHISAEYVQNPEKPEKDDWKNCLSFHETPTLLVLNRSRSLMMAEAFGPTVAGWINRKVVLYVGEADFDFAEGHVQICIASAEDGQGNAAEAVNVDDVNSVLFG